MKKILLIALLTITFTSFSQQKPSFWDNVRYGGGFSLGFGSSTTIAISPSAIYDFNNGFYLGAGLSYLYNKQDFVRSNVFGASIIGLYEIPTVNLQISSEFEQLYLHQKNGATSFNDSYPALHLGIAYQTGSIAFGLRYDVLYNQNRSIYSSPFSPIVRFYL